MSEFCHSVLSPVISLTVKIWSTHELSGQIIHPLPFSFTFSWIFFFFCIYTRIIFLRSANKSFSYSEGERHLWKKKEWQDVVMLTRGHTSTASAPCYWECPLLRLGRAWGGVKCCLWQRPTNPMMNFRLNSMRVLVIHMCFQLGLLNKGFAEISLLCRRARGPVFVGCLPAGRHC